MLKKQENPEEANFKNNSKSFTKIPCVESEINKNMRLNKVPIEKPKGSISLNKNMMKKIKILKGDYDSNGDISASQNSSIKFVKKVGSSHIPDNISKNLKKFTFDNIFSKKSPTSIAAALANAGNSSYLMNSQLISNNPIQNPNLSVVKNSAAPSSMNNNIANLNQINSFANNSQIGPMSGHNNSQTGQISININNFNFHNFNINSTTKSKHSLNPKNPDFTKIANNLEFGSLNLGAGPGNGNLNLGVNNFNNMQSLNHYNNLAAHLNPDNKIITGGNQTQTNGHNQISQNNQSYTNNSRLLNFFNVSNHKGKMNSNLFTNEEKFCNDNSSSGGAHQRKYSTDNKRLKHNSDKGLINLNSINLNKFQMEVAKERESKSKEKVKEKELKYVKETKENCVMSPIALPPDNDIFSLKKNNFMFEREESEHQRSRERKVEVKKERNKKPQAYTYQFKDGKASAVLANHLTSQKNPPPNNTASVSVNNNANDNAEINNININYVNPSLSHKNMGKDTLKEDVIDKQEEQHDVSFIDELNDLLGVEDNNVKRNKMMCYEESLLLNRTYFGFDNINGCEKAPHVVENSYLEITKNQAIEDESLICINDGLANNFLENWEIAKEEQEVPDPRINFEQLQQVNARRPQTSYGGISARQRNRKISAVKQPANENPFPDPGGMMELDSDLGGALFGIQNKLLAMNNK